MNEDFVIEIEGVKPSEVEAVVAERVGGRSGVWAVGVIHGDGCPENWDGRQPCTCETVDVMIRGSGIPEGNRQWDRFRGLNYDQETMEAALERAIEPFRVDDRSVEQEAIAWLALGISPPMVWQWAQRLAEDMLEAESDERRVELVQQAQMAGLVAGAVAARLQLGATT